MGRRTFSRAIAPLVDFVYPPRCPLCGEGIAAGPGLCASCWDELEFPGHPACDRCQLPLPSATADPVCTACQAIPPRHSGISAGVLYTESARQLVLRFKHGGRIGLASLMARLIVGRLGDVSADAVLVPVPLHRTRLWLRGYNQAALLARAMAAQTGHAVVVDGLRRTRATPMLGGLGRADRAKTLRGAIAMNPARSREIAGREVILVDDVLTSGATTDACVRVLLAAGADKVRIACFARVPEPRHGDIELPGNETPGTSKVPGAA
ncbi:MAG: ComF family protein [Erythrobacter sp.]|nr:ComF family protein [Erythrobacter sp.]NCQ64570.1 ComF family protein [Alphaproteobacteria bacterium]